MKRAKLSLVAAVCVLAFAVSSSVAFAGEITGNGTPLWTSTDPVTGDHTLHGKSACAFSGQEDDQFLGGPDADNKSQSWGQIARHAGGALGGVPGTACNPVKSSGAPE
jgi:hypothetical protein